MKSLLRQTIESYFLPPSSTQGGKPDPPLRAGDSLNIGYGSGGAPPFQYFLRKGQNIDLGFLKLFLTSTYVDLSSIVQESPFGGGGGDVRKILEDKTVVQMPLHSTWDQVMIAVVQKRASLPM